MYAQRHRRRQAVSADARTLAGPARADRPARRVDLQPRLHALQPGRRDLGDRLVHGPAGAARPAAAQARRGASASSSSPGTTCSIRFSRSAGLAESGLSGLWKILYLGFSAGPIALGDGGPAFWVLYSIVPWVGVMAAGYAFGAVLMLEPRTAPARVLCHRTRRDRTLSRAARIESLRRSAAVAAPASSSSTPRSIRRRCRSC